MTARFKRYLICFVAVLLSALAGFSLPFFSTALPGVLNEVNIVSGSVDMSGITLGANDDIYLSGEWEFFWNKHIISDNEAVTEPDLYVQVPSAWTSYTINGKELSNGGRASYRAYLKNINATDPFVVSVPDVPGECNVYIDGKRVFSNRSASGVGEGDLPVGLYVDSVFPSAQQDVIHEIVIEMTCDFSSGLTTIPMISSYEHFQTHTMGTLAMRYLFIGVVAFFAIGVLMLSIMNKESGNQFWLVVLCVAFVFRMLISSEAYIASHDLFVDINFEIMMSLVYVSTYIIKLAMMMYVISALNINVSQTVIVFISALFLICAFVPYFLYDYIYVANAYMWLQSVSYILDVFMIYKIAGAIVRKKRFAVLYIIAYCITAAAIIVDNFYMTGYISKSVSFIMPLGCVVFISCMVLIHFLQTAQAYKEAKRAAELSKELSDMNMTLMLSQIQPHFLYNALNTIKYLTKKDPKSAEHAIVKFSNYLRANMDSLTQKEPIPFSKEIDHVKNYISIECLRFGDRLKVEYDIQYEDFLIPPLTVQPIAENAIKHGVNQRPEGGTVKISSYKAENGAVVTIEDDGVGFDVNRKPDDNRSHVGINNIKVRLKEMLNADVTVESIVGEGTRVTMTIPRKENE